MSARTNPHSRTSEQGTILRSITSSAHALVGPLRRAKGAKSQRRVNALSTAVALLFVATMLGTLPSPFCAGPFSGVEPAYIQTASVFAQAQNETSPVADAGPDITVVEGTTVTFNGSGSHGPVGIVNYTWKFSFFTMNVTLYGMTPQYPFALPGTFEVTLNVTDANGLHDTDTVSVAVTEKRVSLLHAYWWAFAAGGALLGVLALLLVVRIKGVQLVSTSTREKTRLLLRRNKKIAKQVLKDPMGAVGTAILVFFIFIAAFGPALAPYDVSAGEKELTDVAYMKPSGKHWMGTDVFSLDIFSELFVGARTSMIVGIFSALIASVLGALVGLYSGFAGGWKDEVIMRMNDVVLSIPWLVLMIIVAAMLGKIDLTGIILIIGLTGWSFTARMVRAQVLSIKERQYIERARAVGASEFAILRRHVFPNTFPLVFANTILTVAISILSESTLSFLGLRPQGAITWGTMLSYASSANAFQIGLHWWIVAPGLCIVFVVLGFTLMGYALDDALNPKLRRR